jgi:chitodextrinase
VSAARKHTALALVSLALVAVLSLAGGAVAGGASKHDRQAPTAPTNLRVTGTTAYSLSVAWDPASDNVGVAGYYLYVVGGHGDGRRTKVVSTSYVAQGLQCGDSVDIWVTAYDAAGNRSPQVEVTASTAACPDLQAPTIPTGFTQQATTQNAVVLAWQPSADNVGVVGYDVYRSAIAVAHPTDPTATLGGLACGSVYQYTVDALDAAGNRSGQGTAWVQTADCDDSQAPTPPTGLAVTGHTPTSLSLSWTASTDNVGVAGYRISIGSTPMATVTGTSGQLTGLACGTTFAVSVDAFDASGNRSTAATTSGKTDDCSPAPLGDTTPPTQPGGLAVSASTATSVTLAWLASTDNVGVVGYGVYKNGVLVSSPGLPGATISGLTCGTAYTLEVDAYDLAGNRSTRASATASTAACADTQPPTAPRNVTATSRTSNSIALSWSASSDNVSVAGYSLYRGGSKVATVTGTTGIFSGLTCNTNYTLAVDAYDAAGNHSSQTSVMVATTACPDTTPPSAPTSLSASNVTQTGATLSWTASSDNVGVAGYDLYANATKVGSTSATTYGFSALTCGASNTLAVVAYDAAGNQSAKASVTVATTSCRDTTPPSTPTGLATSNVTQTAATLTWKASSDDVGVAGYDVYSNGVKAGSTSGTSYGFAGLTCGTSYALGVVAFDAAGNRSPQAQLTTSTSTCSSGSSVGGTALSSISDLHAAFVPQWISPVLQGGSGGGGIWNTSTPLGAGLKFVATDQMPAPWDSNTKVALAVMPYESAFLGNTEDWSGSIMFPSAGNPNGFPQYWHAGTLFEFHTETTSGNHLAVDNTTYSTPRFRFQVNTGPNTFKSYWSQTSVAYDRWYSFRLRIKWSSGSDGFLQGWIGNEQVVDYAGPTIPSGEHPKLQFGYYSHNAYRNEVWFANVHSS